MLCLFVTKVDAGGMLGGDSKRLTDEGDLRTHAGVVPGRSRDPHQQAVAASWCHTRLLGHYCRGRRVRAQQQRWGAVFHLQLGHAGVSVAKGVRGRERDRVVADGEAVDAVANHAHAAELCCPGVRAVGDAQVRTQSCACAGHDPDDGRVCFVRGGCLPVALGVAIRCVNYRRGHAVRRGRPSASAVPRGVEDHVGVDVVGDADGPDVREVGRHRIGRRLGDQDIRVVRSVAGQVADTLVCGENGLGSLKVLRADNGFLWALDDGVLHVEDVHKELRRVDPLRHAPVQVWGLVDVCGVLQIEAGQPGGVHLW